MSDMKFRPAIETWNKASKGVRDFSRKRSEEVEEIRKNRRNVSSEKSDSKKDGKIIDKAIEDHKREILGIAGKNGKKVKELDKDITGIVAEKVDGRFYRTDFNAQDLQKKIEDRIKTDKDIENANIEFKGKQSKVERYALEAHLDGIQLTHERGKNKRTWEQWNKEKSREYWRDMLEGRNRRMIDQLKRYGLENDRSLRNVSHLTHEDLEGYAKDRSDREDYSLDDHWDEVKNDFLNQYKNWQKGEDV